MRYLISKFYTQQKKDNFQQKAKALLRDWLPPKLISFLKKIWQHSPRSDELSWHGDFSTWQDAIAVSGGYDDEAIFTKAREAARSVRDGKALWERDTVLFHQEEYNLPLIANLMTVAAWNEGRLNVLDFGGAFGSTYMQHRTLLNGLRMLHWNIVEQSKFVEWGKHEFSSNTIRFFHTIEECCKIYGVDIILFSSVLQYIEDPYKVFESAVDLGPQAIIIDRTPFSSSRERITVQYVPQKIYAASYPCRWLDRRRLDKILKERYHIMPDHTTSIDAKGFYGFAAIRLDCIKFNLPNNTEK